jgi:hypothetical protein
MIHRRFFLAAASAGLAMAVADAADYTKGQDMSYFQEIFTVSLNEKKGVTVYMSGQSIPGIVTKINGGDTVEMRNREVSRIIIRIDRIDAVTMS